MAHLSVIVLNLKLLQNFRLLQNNLVNNLTFQNGYNLNWFKIIKSLNNIFMLFKLETVCILLKKPVLCKHKYFDLFIYFRYTYTFKFVLLSLHQCIILL